MRAKIVKGIIKAMRFVHQTTGTFSSKLLMLPDALSIAAAPLSIAAAALSIAAVALSAPFVSPTCVRPPCACRG